jgi:prevent-host-death family protein
MTMVAPTKYQTFGAEEFKARCLRLMEKVARTGNPLLVTQGGKPLVRIVPAADREWDEAAWRERGRATLIVTGSDDDLVRSSGQPRRSPEGLERVRRGQALVRARKLHGKLDLRIDLELSRERARH